MAFKFGACALAGRSSGRCGPCLDTPVQTLARRVSATGEYFRGPLISGLTANRRATSTRGAMPFEQSWHALCNTPDNSDFRGLGTGRLGNPSFTSCERVAQSGGRRSRFGGPGTGRPGKPPFYARRRATARRAPVRGPGTGRPGKPLFYTRESPFRRIRSRFGAPDQAGRGKPRFYSGRALMLSRHRPPTSALSQAPCRRRVDSNVSRTPFPCGSSFQRNGASPIRS